VPNNLFNNLIILFYLKFNKKQVIPASRPGWGIPALPGAFSLLKKRSQIRL
jgi:hypothetical protein